MRSTLDERGVCAVCAPDADAGTITLHPAGDDIPAPPVPTVEVMTTVGAGGVVDGPHLVVRDDTCPCTGQPIGTGDCDGSCAECETLPDDHPLVEQRRRDGWTDGGDAEPKQRPVKRRWWRGRR